MLMYLKVISPLFSFLFTSAAGFIFSAYKEAVNIRIENYFIRESVGKVTNAAISRVFYLSSTVNN